MGKVIIARTDEGFDMNSGSSDAITAMELFVDAIRKTYRYLHGVGIRSIYGDGTNVTGCDEGGSEYILGWMGPPAGASKYTHSFRVHCGNKAEAVRKETIDALQRAGLYPSFR
ncbi:MAG: hypothetical protein JXC85_05630 [Candidatus Aenigmarchaeota archaeon]|nr:hypothetical protein [Candidatus Aenigmarchaeota archaeon]